MRSCPPPNSTSGAPHHPTHRYANRHTPACRKRGSRLPSAFPQALPLTGLPAGDHTQFELAAQLLEDALHDDMKGYLADILSPGAVRPALLPSDTAIHLTRGRGGLLHHASIRWVSPRLWALLRGCACVFHGVLRSQHACPPMRHVVAVWASDPCPQEKVKRGREIIKDRDTKSADAGDGGEQPSTAPATYASLHPFRYAYKRTYMFARTSRAPTCLCTNPPRLHPPSSMSSFLFLVCFNFENLWCNTWGGLIAKKVVWRNWGTKSCDVFLCIFWPRLPKIFLLFFGEFSDITPVFDSFAFFPAVCHFFSNFF